MLKYIMTKIVDWAKKHKKLSVLLVLLTACLLIFLYFYFSKKTVTPPISAPKIKFELTNTLPASGVQEMIFPRTSIGFTFSKPIKKGNTRFTVSPFVELEIVKDSDSQTLYLRPKKEWTVGTTYTVSITHVEAVDGDLLNEEILYEYKPIAPQNSSLTE